MKILLDTNALIWLFVDSPRLGAHARAYLLDRGNEIIVSMVSFWEIALKVRTGKLRLDVQALFRHTAQGGVVRLNIEETHLLALRALPKMPDHRDPFDHLLIAQAVAEQAAILTADRRFIDYPVRCLPCDDPPAS